MTSGTPFPIHLTKIDALAYPDHYYLETGDKCYFLGECTARKGFAFSETNRLVLNLKKPMDRRNKPEWKYKEKAIKEAGAAFGKAIPTEWLDRGGDRAVQIQLFGGLNLNRARDPLYAKDNQLQVASLADLAGMKIAVIQKRAQWRDFVDVGAILESGLSLGCMVAATQAIYGKQFNPMIALKALSYHNDIDLSEALPEEVEQLSVSLRRIHRSIAQLDLNHLPKVVARTGFRRQQDMHNEID